MTEEVAAGTRTLVVTIKGVSADFELLDWVAPKTAEALWASLPIDAELTHAAWAGAAAWFKCDKAPVAGALTTVNEHPVTSLYPGTIVIRPHVGPAEMFISYGISESRYDHGTTFATPVARIRRPSPELFAEIGRTWTEGTTRINIAQKADS